jgi:hypothetical protein
MVQATKFFCYFLIKNCNLLIPRFQKGRPSYRRSLQLSKENIQHVKTWNSYLFIFLRVIFATLVPEESGSGSTDLIKAGTRIRYTAATYF